MNLQTFLFFLILAGIAAGSIYYNIKMHSLLRNHVGRWDAMRIAMTLNNIDNKIPENEWEHYKSYRRKVVRVFFGGFVLIVLLIILGRSL